MQTILPLHGTPIPISQAFVTARHDQSTWRCSLHRIKRVQSNPFGWLRAFGLIVLMLEVGGCAQFRLAAVPAADTHRASVLGIPNARFFANDTAALVSESRNLKDRAAKYYASIGRPLPPANVLAISGGGDNGAFGAGLLVGWSESGKRPSFNAVTGISTGAMIAPFAFLGPEYDQVLAGMFTTIDQRDVFEKRLLLAAFGSDALEDTTPLKNMIAQYLDQRIVERIAEEYRHGRSLVIITTDLDAGLPVIWNIGAIAESGRLEAVTLIRQILLASAAIPGAFPPVMFDVTVDGVNYQEMHVDGGTTQQTFLYPPTLSLRALPGAGPRRPHTAYIIRNAKLTDDWSEVKRTTLSIASRAVSTLIISSGTADLYGFYAALKRDGADFRLGFIGDDFTAPHPDEFDHTYMTKLFEYGRAKARAGYPWRIGPPGFLTKPVNLSAYTAAGQLNHVERSQ